jgi:FAD/FMN-containing dehydrogenase
MDDGLIDRFKALAGPQGWIDGASDDARPYLIEWRDRWPGQSRLILRPQSTQEVAQLCRLAHETGTALVPQGGNTGLVGGQMPMQGEFVLSLSRMTKIRRVDPLSDSLIVEAGVSLAAVQQAADHAGRLFPLSLASEGSATIGGLIATNAGGTAVLRYGPMRDLVLGLEVVLADGRVLERLSILRKDNTGFDPKHLFIGTEGRFGIITAATLKLFARPRDIQTAFVAVSSIEQALELLALAKDMSGGRVTGFEIIPKIGLDYLHRHRPALRQPLSLDHPWYILMELTGGDPPGPLAQTMENLLAQALDQGLIQDAAIAGTIAQGRSFWALREEMSGVQKHEGGSIKHDIAVPLHHIPAFITRATAAVLAIAPGCRPVPFGHLGDGNIHFNVSQPVGADTAAYLALWPAMAHAVHSITHDLGGSISAEHGIGQAKMDDLIQFSDPVSLDLLRQVKLALDPKGIFNPGKVLI